MIIKRQKGNSLWWISENLDLNGTFIEPAVPQNFMTSRKIIDHKMPRTVLYESLEDALSMYSCSGGKKVVGKVLGVYRPKVVRLENRLEPSLSDCPYRDVLEGKEIWCLLPVILEKVANIRVDSVAAEKKFKTGLGNTKASAVDTYKIPVFKWTEVLPEWDKKGKTRKL